MAIRMIKKMKIGFRRKMKKIRVRRKMIRMWRKMKIRMRRKMIRMRRKMKIRMVILN